jgi:hypothetical protein
VKKEGPKRKDIFGLMSNYKSRGAYAVEVCIGPCANRDKKCSECIGKNKFVKIVTKEIDDVRENM